MRATILCLCFVLAGAAADRESITLADGRTLVGIYDETAGTIALDGGKLTVQVKADAVKARGPAPEAVAVVAKAKPDEAQSELPVEEYQRVARLSSEYERRSAKLAEDYQRESFAAIKAWLGSAELLPLPNVKLPADPRQSERDEEQKVREINARISELRKIKADLPNVTEKRVAIYTQAVLPAVLLGAGVWPAYVKHGGR